ncbi:MAG: Fur family transcriptional regulator [Acetivibrionales bacterium]|jgi:Fur family ferric uptake transcriptional regulator
MGFKNHYDDILKNGNLKPTKHRNAMLGVLDSNNSPISAEDLYMRLKEKGISISLSTVYRGLETLNEKGIIIRSILPDYNKAVYEINRNEHRHHLICVKCHKMLPVKDCPLEEYEKLIENKFDFTVKGHNLEVYGYCNSCESINEKNDVRSMHLHEEQE